MVAALIAVANGRITEKDIVEMLHNPNPYNYHKAIRPVPAHGLFLKSVDYNDEGTVTDSSVLTKNRPNCFQTFYCRPTILTSS